MRNPRMGKVTLVGAGPGDPELLTLRALRAIEDADVIVHDRLVSAEIMALVPPHVRCIDVGKLPHRHAVPQEEINELLVSLALQGCTVARLKGGDPLIFGRGGEEAAALRDAGIAVTCVPGITAAQGAAAAAGLPLTQRGIATGLRYVTGHRARDADLDLDWASLASPDTTLVIYMGAATIGDIACRLMAHGLPGATPVLMVASATTAREARCLSTLARICQDAAPHDSAGPILFIVGQVVSLYPGAQDAAALPPPLAELVAAAHD